MNEYQGQWVRDGTETTGQEDKRFPRARGGPACHRDLFVPRGQEDGRRQELEAGGERLIFCWSFHSPSNHYSLYFTVTHLSIKNEYFS